MKALVVYGSIQSGSTSLWAKIADRNKMQHLERKTALCEGDFFNIALFGLIYKKKKIPHSELVECQRHVRLHLKQGPCRCP